MNTKIETYIPNTLGCQKHGHLKINALDHQYVEIPITQNENVKIPLTASSCTGEHPVYSRECKMWKKELQK